MMTWASRDDNRKLRQLQTLVDNWKQLLDKAERNGMVISAEKYREKITEVEAILSSKPS